MLISLQVGPDSATDQRPQIPTTRDISVFARNFPPAISIEDTRVEKSDFVYILIIRCSNVVLLLLPGGADKKVFNFIIHL